MKVSKIIDAKLSFGETIKTSELEKSQRLSQEYSSEIYLKREDTQIVRSYKLRGAYNAINSLEENKKKLGIVCASAGNHAQGVAYTCNKLQIKGTIFMPKTTPEQKVYKTKKFGGDFVDIKLIGDSFDDAYNEAKDFQNKNNLTFVHPFDDENIIVGQATIGLEILEQLSFKPDIIIYPIGGGGLVSGLISTMKELSPNTTIIGVEPEGAPAMKNSLERGKNSTLEKINTFVDGAAVKRVGEKTFEIAKKYRLDVKLVPENRVCTTLLEYLREDGLVLEPAGALATDVLKDLRDEIKGKKVVVIVSGGNFDFERLPEVKERSLKYEGLKKYIMVSFPQRPGALKEFLGVLGPGDDITRFEYLKKSNKEKAPALIGIESKNRDSFKKIFEKLDKVQIAYEDITQNDMYYDLLI